MPMMIISSYILKHVLTESLYILNTKYDYDKLMNESGKDSYNACRDQWRQ